MVLRLVVMRIREMFYVLEFNDSYLDFSNSDVAFGVCGFCIYRLLVLFYVAFFGKFRRDIANKIRYKVKLCYFLFTLI